MASSNKVFLVILFSVSCFLTPGNTDAIRKKRQALNRFPDDFEFGTATSSYQVEGAWNEDGKGWSMWDHMVRTRPESISDGTNGDVAANSYNLYERDVEMLVELGVNNYRFSISWPRILPYGRPDYVNPLGIAYYNNLINALLAKGITPFVTMYHWDLPQNLNEQGAWLNEDIVDWFGDYARVLYQHFGDRVKHWMTINEPYIHCHFGYEVGRHAPSLVLPGVGFYECGRNILLANARAYRIYDEEFRAEQGGEVGFVVSMEWGMPATDSAEDAEALRDFKAFHIDYFIHPIWTEEGGYPPIVTERVAAASASQGLAASRLRPFTAEEVAYMKGTADFLGLNHYSSEIVYRNESINGIFGVPSTSGDLHVGSYADPSWLYDGFTREYGPGLYHLLIYLRDNYNHVPIYITENGFGCTNCLGLNDDNRVQYFRSYLTSVLNAVLEGVNLKGYFAWSLMDNFEWSFGYSIRFGIYEVDMDSENRTRTPRKSALVIQEIIRSRVIDYSFDPDPYARLEDEEDNEEANEEDQEDQEDQDNNDDNTDGGGVVFTAPILLVLGIAVFGLL